MVWQTAAHLPPSPPSPHSLNCAVLWQLPGRQLDNPWIFCHSTDACVFCSKRINPSMTSSHPPTPLLFFATVTVASSCMRCVLTLQVTQAWASWGSFWYQAQKLCATFTLNVPLVCVFVRTCACVHMLHPVSEDPWHYHAANKRPPVPVC